MREFDGHVASRRSPALASARTRSLSSTSMLSSIREAEHVARAFSLLFCWYGEGEAFNPKLLSRELTRSRPTAAYVDPRAASLASVSLWTSYAEDACSGAHHVACDEFRVVLFIFLVVVFWCLFLSVFACVSVRVYVYREK